jgi:hypothetical protein
MHDAGPAQPPAAEQAGRLSARESLALISEQRAGAVRSLYPSRVPMLASWGVAWLFGFGACYLAQPGRGAPALPDWSASAILFGLSLVAVVVTARQFRRSGRGVTGPGRAVGAMYGWSWVLGSAVDYALNLGLASHGMPARLESLLWPVTTLLVVGLLYLAGGMAWQDRLMYGLGAWMLLVAVASVAVGVPANFALIALAGGGGLLTAAGLARRARRWRVRR